MKLYDAVCILCCLWITPLVSFLIHKDEATVSLHIISDLEWNSKVALYRKLWSLAYNLYQVSFWYILSTKAGQIYQILPLQVQNTLLWTPFYAFQRKHQISNNSEDHNISIHKYQFTHELSAVLIYDISTTKDRCRNETRCTIDSSETPSVSSSKATSHFSIKQFSWRKTYSLIYD